MGKAILLMGIGAVVGAGFLLLYLWLVAPAGTSAFGESERGEYIDLLLSLITVMLGIVGILVAGGALAIGIFSWKVLHETVKKAVEESSGVVAEKVVSMSKDGDLDDAIERVVARMTSGDENESEDNGSR